MASDPATFSASELIRLYRDKALSPVEVTRAVLERIRRFDSDVVAFCLVDEEQALASARAAEARWQRGEPLGLVDGVPTALKDMVLTRGWPTLRGSQVVDAEGPWGEDAPAAARLREQGAVLIGKTTMPEFGWKAVTDCALTGITRNPWALDRTPGGSSGGAAAACALGMGALHVGSDGGGSIRIPAAFTGVFGLKPSFGRVPAAPLGPYGSLSHVGPLTRTVADAALMLNVLALPDPRDWQALPYDGRDYAQDLDGGVQGLRIAFSPALGYARVEPDVADRVARAAALFQNLGAVVEEIDPGFDDPRETFRTHWYAAVASLMRGFTDEQRAMMDSGLRELAEDGARIGLMDYLAAASDRNALGIHMRQFHQHYDLLLTPAVPITAFAAGQEVPEPREGARWFDWAPFSSPFNLTQQPAASVPCGLSDAGLPVGLQIVGPMHADALVLRAARALEAAQPWSLPATPRQHAS